MNKQELIESRRVYAKIGGEKILVVGGLPMFHEPTYTKTDLQQLIEAIAVGVEGLDKYDEDFENGYPAYKSPDGYWVPYHEVLEAIRSTKI